MGTLLLKRDSSQAPSQAMSCIISKGRLSWNPQSYFRVKWYASTWLLAKKKSHDCLEAALHCFWIEPFVRGSFFFFSFLIVLAFFSSPPLLQQTKKTGRRFIQNKHLFDTQDSGYSPSLNWKKVKGQCFFRDRATNPFVNVALANAI